MEIARQAAATGLLLLAGASPAVARPQLQPDGFELVPFQGTFSVPTDLAFAADGSFFVTEKRGIVWFHDGTAKQAAPFLDLEDEVNLNGDRGLLAVALHPGWAPGGGPRSWVYLLLTVSPVYGENWGYNENDQYSFSRLVRYKAVVIGPDVVADPATREVLLGTQLPDGRVPDGIASLSAVHAAGTLLFAPDGTLLVSNGDGAQVSTLDFGGLDPAGFEDFVHPETGLRGPTPQDQDSGAFRAQDLRSLAGKILRLDPATGDGLPTNPFFDGDPASNASRVWALGLRNAFRFSLVPGTGSSDPSDGDPGVIYAGDVGWITWEELNVIHGGENCGWPCFEGPLPHPAYQAFTAGSSQYDYLDCSTADFGKPTLPALAWHHNDPTLVSPPGVHLDGDGLPGPGFVGGCAIGGAHYTGSDYPAPYQGAYFLIDFRSQWMKTLRLDAGHAVTEVRDFGLGFDRPVDLEVHPLTSNLVLLMIEGGTGRAFELRYDDNATPVAVASAEPTHGDAPLLVSFDGGDSYDPDQDPLVHEWDFGDGSPVNFGPVAIHTYVREGVYGAVLTVTDPGGRTSEAGVQIVVGNTPPVVHVDAPVAGQFFDPGEVVTFSGTATDLQDPTLDLEWEVDLYHNDALHPGVFQTTDPSPTFTLEPFGEPGDLFYYRVTLTAQDSGGLEGEESIYLYPRDNVRDVSGTAIPIARIFELQPPDPEGLGNEDFEVVRDRVLPPAGTTDPLLQYDTEHYGEQGDDDWIGYELPAPPGPEQRFVSVGFQEGLHYATGGWWESFTVEVRSDGTWQPVQNLRVTPDYPFELADRPLFDDVSFETYLLDFDPAEGDAVRLRGAPGGNLDFTSVGELRAKVVKAMSPLDLYEDVTAAGQVIARVFELDPPFPTGRGSTEPDTIRNGTWPQVGSESLWGQYDSFHDGDQGSVDWIGYAYAEPRDFVRVLFQEGFHSAVGGRFQTLSVQTQEAPGEPWIDVTNLAVAPPYPGDPDLAATYETFELTFDLVQARAIRLYGAPEGSIGYVSVGELRVYEPAGVPGCTVGPDVQRYCVAAPNSGGAGAVLDVTGCTSVALNEFGLSISGAPRDASGIFYYGNGSTFTAFGDGFRCVKGSVVVRLDPFHTDDMGAASQALDFTQPPSTEATITPGSTWNFQGWYRDPGGPGGTGFNLSDALRVTFAP